MILKLKGGKIKGKCLPDDILRFAGIPYAKPPVGELRWKAPQEPLPWEGELDCTEFTRCAYQMNADEWGGSDIPNPYGPEWNIREKEIRSEDCLYLNVWTSRQALEEKKKLPVLCIIHGGGFESGSGGVRTLDGEQMAKHGIVVVTINYRMGVFGYLAHPELTEESSLHTSGNYGLLDQIQALKWIQKNIEVFGGDASQVTVSGESAGSISVNGLYESPFAKGLFARAAMESGTHMGPDTYCPQVSLRDAESQGTAFVSGKANSIEELRKMTTEEVFAGSWGFFPFKDGVVWPEHVFEEGKQNDVPLLLGSNSDEGSIFTYLFGTDDIKLRFVEQANARYGEDAEPFLNKFPVTDATQAMISMSHAYGEKLFGYSIYRIASLQNKYGESNVYYYYFDRVLPMTKEYGAYHSSELPYFYRTMDESDGKWEKRDFLLRDQMSAYMLQFVKTGNPNVDSMPAWRTFEDDPKQVMELGDHIGMITHPASDMYEIYDHHLGERVL